MDKSDEVRLAEEAEFANAAYRKSGHHLQLNEAFFRKYAAPTEDWDWRQWGAKRLGSVAGCRVLDYGCGAGEESVYLAKMGADVTAIDISPVGVELTNARAKFNGVSANLRAQQMRCDPTEFTDESFDVIHGFGILHHIGLRIGLLEARRLLVPGGRGLFFEHMGNSAIIESIRPKEGHYTEGERPVRWTEILELAPHFSRLEATPFHIASRLRNKIRFFGSTPIKRLDRALLSSFPRLRHFASGVVIYIEK